MPGVAVDTSTGTTFDTVVHTATMGEVLGRHLIGRADGAEVVSCRVARYRHRPGVRCLVQYDVRVRDAAGREADLRVTGQWHAARGQSDALYPRLAAAADSAALQWSAALPPVFFDRATAMIATTYPWDRRMPSLPEVASGRSADLLAPMLAWMEAPVTSLDSVVVETVRYREQLNAVCRYTVKTRMGPCQWRESRFFAKAYVDDGGAHAAAILAELGAATPAGGGSARVHHALAYVERLRTLVLADTPGVALDRISLDRGLALTLARVAAALARFGQLAVRLDRQRPQPNRLASLDRSCSALAADLPERALELTAARTRATSIRETAPAGPTHGDVKLEHVFVNGPEVFLIDVDSCHLGDPLWDLALLQARWWAARDASAEERALRDWGWRALQVDYLTHVPAAAARRLPPLQAMALLDVAAGIAKRREPDWMSRALRIVDAARAVDGASA
jgi:hypothetical protein